MDQKPSVGRIVHYMSILNGDCLAAIVTRVHATGEVDLVVFYPGDPDIDMPTEISEGTEGLTWHWPKRV